LIIEVILSAIPSVKLGSPIGKADGLLFALGAILTIGGLSHSQN
jgi:hypothetical protein